MLRIACMERVSGGRVIEWERIEKSIWVNGSKSEVVNTWK
jgi:hypothetical protein